MQGAVIYAALGRQEEARATVADALKRHPNLTIEGFALNSPGYSDIERQKLADGMRAAGFPPCAKPEQLQGMTAPIRLPECKMASPR